MTTEVKRSEILEATKLTETAAKLMANPPESQYFRYWVPGEKYVTVESTASKLMLGVTCFSMEDQALIFCNIANRLKEPGDSIIIVDDSDKQKRMAFVTRLKGPENDIRLLITR